MTDADYDDEDLDDEEVDLSPQMRSQMRSQMDRLLMNDQLFGAGGRARIARQGPIRRRIEDWHDSRAIDRSVDYLNDRLD